MKRTANALVCVGIFLATTTTIVSTPTSASALPCLAPVNRICRVCSTTACYPA